MYVASRMPTTTRSDAGESGTTTVDDAKPPPEEDLQQGIVASHGEPIAIIVPSEQGKEQVQPVGHDAIVPFSEEAMKVDDANVMRKKHTKYFKMYWLRYDKHSQTYNVNTGEGGRNPDHDVEIDHYDYVWLCNSFSEEVVHQAKKKKKGLDVSTHSRFVGLSNRQLQKLQYISTTQDFLTKKHIPMKDKSEHYYMGCQICLKTKKEVWHGKLATAWVDRTFSKGYLARVRDASSNNRTNAPVWVDVEAGGQRQRLHPPTCILTPCPPIIFKQAQNERSCLFLSLANALHYLQMKAGFTLFEYVRNPSFINQSNRYEEKPFHLLNKFVMKEIAWLRPTKFQNVCAETFLQDISCYPKVVQLFGSDGNTEHGVTVVDNYIFDSNCTTAIPFNRDNLNYCCSTDEDPGTFDHVHRGIQYSERKEKKYKWLRPGCDRNILAPYTFREFPPKQKE